MEYRRGSHSLYDLKYHIVFCTKYRYRVLTGQIATSTREVMREICAANDIGIISGSMSPDNVHILVLAPPSISISKALQYIRR
ncbi:MAG: IS200/IS605 family transposase [Candidatus Midichloria sp.]|nr:IS200/IS605 family transposase [Candidatus Midichloria sp.]